MGIIGAERLALSPGRGHGGGAVRALRLGGLRALDLEDVPVEGLAARKGVEQSVGLHQRLDVAGVADRGEGLLVINGLQGKRIMAEDIDALKAAWQKPLNF